MLSYRVDVRVNGFVGGNTGVFKRGLADLVAYQCKLGAILILPALGL